MARNSKPWRENVACDPKQKKIVAWTGVVTQWPSEPDVVFLRRNFIYRCIFFASWRRFRFNERTVKQCSSSAVRRPPFILVFLLHFFVKLPIFPVYLFIRSRTTGLLLSRIFFFRPSFFPISFSFSGFFCLLHLLRLFNSPERFYIEAPVLFVGQK